MTAPGIAGAVEAEAILRAYRNHDSVDWRDETLAAVEALSQVATGGCAPSSPPPIGTLVNPEPPEPPVGTELAMEHRPDECVWYRAEVGWRMPEWDDRQFGQWPKLHESWSYVRHQFGPLVVCGHRDVR